MTGIIIMMIIIVTVISGVDRIVVLSGIMERRLATSGQPRRERLFDAKRFRLELLASRHGDREQRSRQDAVARGRTAENTNVCRRRGTLGQFNQASEPIAGPSGAPRMSNYWPRAGTNRN